MPLRAATSPVECLDGAPVLSQPGVARAYVPPCDYERPDVAAPHGYFVSAAQFTPQGIPHRVGVKFEAPVATKEVLDKLEIDALQRIDTRQNGSAQGARVRWFSPRARKEEVWLVEGLVDGNDPERISEVVLHINPFEDVGQARKLMIQHGFSLIDLSRVPALTWRPGLDAQGYYGVLVRQDERGSSVNGQVVAPSVHEGFDEEAKARFTDEIERQLEVTSQRAKALKQEVSRRMYIDATQLMSTGLVLEMTRQGQLGGVKSVDVAVGVMEDQGRDYLEDGRVRPYEMPAVHRSLGEALALHDSNMPPHLEVRLTSQEVRFIAHHLEGLPSEPLRAVAECTEANLCLELVGGDPVEAEREDLFAAARTSSGEARSRAVLAALQAFDPGAIQEAMRRVRAAHPALQHVYIVVAPDVPWQVTVAVMDLIDLDLEPTTKTWDFASLRRHSVETRFAHMSLIHPQSKEQSGNE